MTRKADLGLWIAAVSAVVVIGAVAAGLFVIKSPAEARALRLDAARLAQMHNVAEAAQCAFTFAGRAPANYAQIRGDLRERRKAVPVCDGIALREGPQFVSYEADGSEHVRLCADFLRPTPTRREPRQPWAGRDSFPELREARTSAGRHCFRIRLVNQNRNSQNE